MQTRISKDAVVDDLVARLAGHRSIAARRRAGYQRLALAIDGQPRQWSTQSDRTPAVIVAPQMAA